MASTPVIGPLAHKHPPLPQKGVFSSSKGRVGPVVPHACASPFATYSRRNAESGQPSSPLQVKEHLGRSAVGRREATLGSFFSLSVASTVFEGVNYVASPPPAFGIGFSGLKEWLQEQKKKNVSVFLNPIAVSSSRLDQAVQALFSDSEEEGRQYDEAMALVRDAALDCLPASGETTVSVQTQLGRVEVCTFKLILKNAGSLLDVQDKRLLQAEDMLRTLILSFRDTYAKFTSPTPVGRNELISDIEQTQMYLTEYSSSIRNVLGLV
eukprot:TRINITY_DN17472_c0_g1_i1.p1 TRINITY_DN17472_c0_g1~~TRINITY_DN17472_c0_g1_i1.p1  ORF type:complete len:278 (+),score=55.67 TRINITY_DN17472_c0_g1_i1:36-836(+)